MQSDRLLGVLLGLPRTERSVSGLTLLIQQHRHTWLTQERQQAMMAQRHQANALCACRGHPVGLGRSRAAAGLACQGCAAKQLVAPHHKALLRLPPQACPMQTRRRPPGELQPVSPDAGERTQLALAQESPLQAHLKSQRRQQNKGLMHAVETQSGLTPPHLTAQSLSLAPLHLLHCQQI